VWTTTGEDHGVKEGLNEFPSGKHNLEFRSFALLEDKPFALLEDKPFALLEDKPEEPLCSVILRNEVTKNLIISILDSSLRSE